MTEYYGYNGAIRVEGEHLYLVREGINAKVAGQAGPPRQIPLQAVSGVQLRDATRMTNGWLQLGLGGTPLRELGVGSAASDPDTVMFRRKDHEAFRGLATWLESVVRHNEATGVDPATVPYDKGPRPVKSKSGPDGRSTADVNQGSDWLPTPPPAGDLTEQVPQRDPSAPRTREDKMRDKLGDSAGGAREDVVAAAARMGWTLGGKRELKKLPEHLHLGEQVRFIAQGTYNDKQGIIVLTEQRLLFLFHGLVGQAKEDFPLRAISSVSTKSGLATGEIRVFASGTQSTITGIVKSDVEPLASALREELATSLRAPSAAPTPAVPQVDPVEQLQKLAQLRDAGIVTDEEFAQKKQQLLDRF